MVGFSNAKLNIGLFVTDKREDGYHNIESLFVPIDLSDAVELIPADANELHIYNAEIPGEHSENSCLRALQLMQTNYSIRNYAVHLLKKIPVGAGLGGGSSNASKTIELINQIEDLQLSKQEMKQLTSELGSDNPFFIENRPMYVTGRGEEMNDSTLDLSGTRVVLIYPTIHRSTKEAYDSVDFAQPTFDLAKATKEDLIQHPERFLNSFQNQFVANYPQTETILEQLKEGNAFYYSLTGSGSTFFGLFEQDQEISQELNRFCEANQYQYIETKIL